MVTFMYSFAIGIAATTENIWHNPMNIGKSIFCKKKNILQFRIKHKQSWIKIEFE